MKTRIYEDLAYLFPLWRETTLETKGAEKREAQFILDILKRSPEKIKTVIDLGGGVGTHAGILAKKGYEVTVFDQSKKALRIAEKNNPKIKTIQGSFESIKLEQTFDAAICMWSTLSYIFTEKGRKNFYHWQSTHIKHLVILDEANFYRYGSTFHKTYKGENKDYRLVVHRDWKLTSQHLKKTKFLYELFDKSTKKTVLIRDAENEQYVTVEALQQYLGRKWQLNYLLGDYSIKTKYRKKNSSRIIMVFSKRKNTSFV